MDVLDKFFTKYSYKFPKGYPDLKDKQDILLMESILEELGVRVRVNEAKLTPSVLSEPATVKGKDKEPRVDILARKIDNGEELTLFDGSTFLVDNKDEVLGILKKWDESVGKITLKDKDGNEITTNNLQKTEEFGGEENVTAKSEAIQAIALAIRFGKGEDIVIGDINKMNIEDVKKYGLASIKAKNTIDDLITWYNDPKNEGWAKSTINTANAIADSSFIDKNKKYFTHWQSEFVEELYKTFNKIKDLSDNEDKNIISVVANDKWNPSDMFVSTDEGFSTLMGITQGKQIDFENIEELNGVINDLFCEREVLGISLKKSEGGTPEIKEYNQEACKTIGPVGTIGDLEFKEYIYSPKGGGVEIHALKKNGESIKLNLRNFNKTAGFSGEIKGLEAAGGKVGIGPINAYLDGNNLIPSSSKEVVKNLLKDPPTKEYMDKFEKLWKAYIGTDFNSWFNKAEPNHKTSRYFALHVVDALEEAGDKKDELLTDLIQYGASSIKDISAPFAKSGS